MRFLAHFVRQEATKHQILMVRWFPGCFACFSGGSGAGGERQGRRGPGRERRLSQRGTDADFTL
jgi:hypothetical protein